jgi:malate dehydrogenase (oxaloacetate-decarboxylating)(NADP+)
MKLSCAYSIADLARSPVPDIVKRAYNGLDLEYGKEYLVPSMFDPRLLTTIPAEVAIAAVKTGVARHFITDWQSYKY